LIGTLLVSRRRFILLLLTSIVLMPHREPAFAKDGESGTGGGGDDGSDGGNSGAGNSSNDNSGSGSRDSGKYKDQYGAQDAVSSGNAISLEDALKRLRARVPGKVISVNLGESGGRLLYWFKVKTSDGAVRKVIMDAKTGRIRGLFGFAGT
jgi:hypothetical protein